MINQEIFAECVVRAGLAPTVHNIQPARWVRDGQVLSLFCDTNICLPVCDPTGAASALSCGAVLEGMVLALSAKGFEAAVTLTGNDTAPMQGLVAVAHLTVSAGAQDGLHHQLEHRFTWRGAFADDPVELFGWTRPDARLVMDHASRLWLAQRNDWASHEIMQDNEFRRELVSWMRLSDRHPRAGLDGMDRRALRMTKGQARGVRPSMLKFWPVLNWFGRTNSMTSQLDLTLSAPVIALFHRDIHENPVESGRAYLRMCLEAASLGLAGWPMAALSDYPTTRAEIHETFGIPSDRRLVQAVRFGKPTGVAPPRARRPLSEVVG
ncbi:nitroreductase family protein [Octadecabacter sp. G9-8]|uniref:Nitroreductase family protein n=1 Tax=Octadecabacter dasysiphoniae TaxID=2909341 RepID=A0ABS9CU58_9RHOB|nr:nitroreductase family protein [Octadecabacter dasysiphoniae]MCF2870369.1 nitroreductase family protein [Octadecabacter dasysiphoniae]